MLIQDANLLWPASPVRKAPSKFPQQRKTLEARNMQVYGREHSYIRWCPKHVEVTELAASPE